MDYYVVLCIGLISLGSMSKHMGEIDDVERVYKYSRGILRVSIIIYIALLVMLTDIVGSIFEVKWYLSILIVFGLGIVSTNIIVPIYAKYLGLKQTIYSDELGKYIKFNDHLFNAILTFIISLILYIFLHIKL